MACVRYPIKTRLSATICKYILNKKFLELISGTETHFNIGKQAAYILNVSSGNRRIGIIHKLLIDDNEVPEYVE